MKNGRGEIAPSRSIVPPELTRRLFRAMAFVFLLNALSAIAFMLVLRHPVYDDGFNMSDVHAYVTKGISAATIQAQTNAPGPLSFIWMAVGVRAFGHDELLDARLGVLCSWLLLIAGTVIGARHTQWPQLWYGALLSTLVFPHAVIASATALTEGPALLFAFLGVLAWTEAISRKNGVSAASLAATAAGGLFMGLAITSRQYYLALLPSAGMLALFLLKERPSNRTFQWIGGVFISMTVSVIPVLLLVSVWKGITCPGIATGASYANYHAGVGLTWFRPIVVFLFVAVYLVPFSFQAMWEVPFKRRLWVAVASLLGGLATAYCRDLFLTLGILHTFVTAASRIRGGGALLFWLISSVAIYNAIAVSLLVWRERSRLCSCPPVIFALFAIVFFIAEQVGVGGNIPFYDRYVLQVAPFLGLLGFWLFPRLTWPRVAAMAVLAAISQATLWQHAFARFGLY
jgi:hypothetical protein